MRRMEEICSQMLSVGDQKDPTPLTDRAQRVANLVKLWLAEYHKNERPPGLFGGLVQGGVMIDRRSLSMNRTSIKEAANREALRNRLNRIAIALCQPRLSVRQAEALIRERMKLKYMLAVDDLGDE